MKTALLIGSSFSAAPLFFALKKEGYEVTVCGAYKDDPLHQYADKSIFVDYANAEELIRYVERDTYDVMVPSCNDYGYLSATKVAEELGAFNGFDSFEVTMILHTKSLFRAFCKKHSIKSPQTFMHADNDICTLGERRLIVKPVDAFSGQGVTVVESKNDLPIAIDKAKKASRSEDVVIEEFTEGSLHSHSAFISNGKIDVEFFVDEFCSVYPFQVDCSCLSSIEEQYKLKISYEIQKIVTILGLTDGLLHTQFIFNGDDFWIIECMRRCPGDLYGRLIQLSTNFDYVSAYLAPFLGQKTEFRATTPNNDLVKFYARHTVSTNRSGVFSSLVNSIPADNCEQILLKTSGENFIEAPKDKFAIIFAEFASEEQMRSYTPILKDYVLVNEF